MLNGWMSNTWCKKNRFYCKRSACCCKRMSCGLGPLNVWRASRDERYNMEQDWWFNCFVFFFSLKSNWQSYSVYGWVEFSGPGILFLAIAIVLLWRRECKVPFRIKRGNSPFYIHFPKATPDMHVVPPTLPTPSKQRSTHLVPMFPSYNRSFS